MSHLQKTTVRGKRLGSAVASVIEELEGRQLLTVTYAPSGLLTIIGTNASDVITVTAKPGRYVSVNINKNAPALFAVSRVKSIYLYSSSGNNRVEMHGDGMAFTIPSTILGGMGNDTILGGSGNEVINGGGGNDLIQSGGGNNVLNGGGGSDTILGGTGADAIYTGPGVSYVSTLGTRNRIAPNPLTQVKQVKQFRPVFPISTYTGIPVGYTPQQIRTAYGFGDLNDPATLLGTGQAIAIIDAYHTPNALADLTTFSAQYGLPLPTSSTFIQYSAGGVTPTQEPDESGNGGSSWATEALLDIQWAHAMAPGATIILVEARTALNTDLGQAIDAAVSLLNARYGGGVVSMSLGGAESTGTNYWETSFNNLYTKNISFVAAAGDTPVASYPATDPHVLAVGGTTLFLDAYGNRVGGSVATIGATGLPTGWTDPTAGIQGIVQGGERPWLSAGCGPSAVYTMPSYQQSRGLASWGTTMRVTPDVSFNADPATGYPVLDSYGQGGAAGWSRIGGTSAAAPQWAALVAIANQYRAQKGLTKVGDQLLNIIYSLGARGPDAYFDDIDQYGIVKTQGGWAYPATIGWDPASGWGSPRVQTLIPAMAGERATTFTNAAVKISGSISQYNPASPIDPSNALSPNPITGYVRSAANSSGTVQGLNTLSFTAGTLSLYHSASATSATNNLMTDTLQFYGLDANGVAAVGNPVMLTRIGDNVTGMGAYTFITTNATGAAVTYNGYLKFAGTDIGGSISGKFYTVTANGTPITSIFYSDPVNPAAVTVMINGKFSS